MFLFDIDVLLFTICLFMQQNKPILLKKIAKLLGSQQERRNIARVQNSPENYIRILDTLFGQAGLGGQGGLTGDMPVDMPTCPVKVLRAV